MKQFRTILMLDLTKINGKDKKNWQIAYESNDVSGKRRDKVMVLNKLAQEVNRGNKGKAYISGDLISNSIGSTLKFVMKQDLSDGQIFDDYFKKN